MCPPKKYIFDRDVAVGHFMKSLKLNRTQKCSRDKPQANYLLKKTSRCGRRGLHDLHASRVYSATVYNTRLSTLMFRVVCAFRNGDIKMTILHANNKTYLSFYCKMLFILYFFGLDNDSVYR